MGNQKTNKLLLQLGLRVCNASPNSLASDAAKEVHRNTERMPGPKILDFLVEYFIAEVNWFVPAPSSGRGACGKSLTWSGV